MSNLDVNTPRGQEALEDERRAAAIFRRRTGWEYIKTPEDSACTVDAILIHDGRMMRIVETKCRRDLTIDKFRNEFRSDWLITLKKLIKAAEIAEEFCLPLVGFLYLKDSDLLLVKRLFCPKKKWLVSFNDAVTKTKASVNGGSAVRRNAFIDMSDAAEFRP